MKVFISWSGRRGLMVAEFMREWLPKVVSPLEPLVSSRDIKPGENWIGGLLKILDSASVGILCLAPEIPDSPWQLFEAGALAKAVRGTDRCVVPFLLPGMDRDRLPAPLSTFQAVSSTDRDAVLKMVSGLNEQLQSRDEAETDASEIKDRFDSSWYELEEFLSATMNEPPDSPAAFGLIHPADSHDLESQLDDNAVFQDFEVDGSVLNQPISYLWAAADGSWIKAEVVKGDDQKGILKIRFRASGAYPPNVAINPIGLKPRMRTNNLRHMTFQARTCKKTKRRVHIAARVRDENLNDWEYRDCDSREYLLKPLELDSHDQGGWETLPLDFGSRDKWTEFSIGDRRHDMVPAFSRIASLVLEFGFAHHGITPGLVRPFRSNEEGVVEIRDIRFAESL